ncbi:MAG: DUF192 domain-containing protein [Thermoanaerobaculaceae bacterium]
MLIASLLLAAAAGPPPAPVCVVPDGARLQLELALTEQEKRTGLMFRDALAADRGMFFPFESDGIFSFHMKNTLIPLDIVWLDAAGRVAEVLPDAPPCRSNPCPMYRNTKKARTVLLVNAGYSRTHGVVPGAQLVFENVPDFAVGRPPK